MKLKTILSVLVLSIFIMSCGEKEKPSLEQDWEVISLQGKTNFDMTAPSLKINLLGKKISGYAGCNLFFGNLTISENNIEFSDLGGTRKICEDMSIEKSYVEALRAVKQYSFNGIFLELKSETNEKLIILKVAEKEKI